MRHIDRGDPRARMHGDDLLTHLTAQLRIEIGQGLIEQKDVLPLSAAPDPRQRCFLPAGELRGPAIEQGLKPEQLRAVSRTSGRSQRDGDGKREVKATDERKALPCG